MEEDRKQKWTKYVVVALTLAIALVGSFKYVSGFAVEEEIEETRQGGLGSTSEKV